MIINLFSRNQTEELVSIGFRLSDYLLSCSYNGIDCSDAFTTSILSAASNCFTLNWKASGKLFTVGDYGDTTLIREGLSMMFYFPQELFFPFEPSDVGLVITLHDNEELSVLTETGLYL
jgi:hypothetical protein